MNLEHEVEYQITKQQIGFSRFGVLIWWMRLPESKWRILEIWAVLPWGEYSIPFSRK